jgi:hypothetical protein
MMKPNFGGGIQGYLPPPLTKKVVVSSQIAKPARANNFVPLSAGSSPYEPGGKPQNTILQRKI